MYWQQQKHYLLKRCTQYGKQRKNAKIVLELPKNA